MVCVANMLFIRISKIQFVCYPQHCHAAPLCRDRCLSGFQRYNLCAIHNRNGKRSVSRRVVYQDFKDTICVLSTTYAGRLKRVVVLFVRISKIQFVCYPQRMGETPKGLAGCLSGFQRCRIYNSAAKVHFFVHIRKKIIKNLHVSNKITTFAS